MTTDSTVRGRRPLWFALALVVVTAAVYANAVPNGFVWDDRYQVRDNEANLRWSELPRLFRLDVGRSSTPPYAANAYRPLVFASYILDRSIFGLRAWGFHLTNVLLHLVIVALGFLLVYHLTGNDWTALVAAGIIALHPGQNEAVGWISGRHDLLPALFSLGALLVHAATRWSLRAWLVPLFLLAALLSKESAIALPLVLVVLDATFYRERLRDLRWLSVYLGVTLAVAIYFMLRGASSGQTPTDLLRVSPLEHWRHYVTIVSKLGYIFAYPLIANPCRIYQVFPDWAVAFGTALLALVLTALVLAFRRTQEQGWRSVLFGLAWFLVTTAPLVFAVPATELIGERYLYLPAVGLALVTAVGLERLSRLIAERFRRPMAVTLIGALIGGLTLMYAVLVVQRNPDWHDDRTLFESVEAQDPFNPVASAQLGFYALAVEKSPSGALFWLQRVFHAYKIPRYTRARTLNYMTASFLQIGRFDLAIKVGRAALDESPGNPKNHFNLALAYMMRARKSPPSVRAADLRRAETHFRRALSLDTQYHRARAYLGMTLHSQKRYRDALVTLEPLLQVRPEVPGVRQAVATLRRKLAAPKP